MIEKNGDLVIFPIVSLMEGDVNRRKNEARDNYIVVRMSTHKEDLIK